MHCTHCVQLEDTISVLTKDVMINVIFNRLDIMSLRCFARTNKKYAQLVRIFLCKTSYKQSYIDYQLTKLDEIARKIVLLRNEHSNSCKIIERLKRFEGDQPDCKLCHEYYAKLTFPYKMFQWQSIKVITSLYTLEGKRGHKYNDVVYDYCYRCDNTKCKKCIIYVKTGHTIETYTAVLQRFNVLGWKQITLTSDIKALKDRDGSVLVAMAFTPNHHTVFKEFRGCKECGSLFHSVLDCKDTKCRACKKTGHIPRNCPIVTCKLCKEKGHIIKFCPNFRCAKCGKQGHSLKECKPT